MKKFIPRMILLFFIVSFFCFYYLYLHWNWRREELLNRAQIAKMLCALEYDNQTIINDMQEMNMDRLPEDVPLTTWYAKYVAVVLNKGWMKTDLSGRFRPGNIFTYGDLEIIMNAFYLTEDMVSFSFQYRQPDACVSKSHWCEVFSLLCVSQKNIIKKECTFIASPSTNYELQAWEVETDDGIKMAEGLVVDDYLNQRVEMFEIDNQILCVIRVLPEKNLQMDEAEVLDDTMEKSKDEDLMVRIILQSENITYDHERVVLTSDEDFLIHKGSITEKYTAGEVIEIKEDLWTDETKETVVETSSGTGTIRLLSLERSCGNPEYKGKILLKKGTTGIWVINEVGLEDYVIGVISSEMPASYDIEALKAQAVCARTYAVKAMKCGFQSYPADVDDTVLSQVYNNQSVTESCVSAAEDTKGMILRNLDEIADVYFFSTSCGHTSTAEDVWYDGTETKTDQAVTAFLADSSVTLDLSKEEDFRSFINLDQDVNYYEEDLPWFRWEVFISAQVIEDKLKDVLYMDVGELKHVEVLERAESGVIKTMAIEGTHCACVVYGEYRIRQIFSPQNSEIVQNKGGVVTGASLLPSGYFYFDEIMEDSLCTGMFVYGGGYGHGCGMSQNGAMKMAEAGKSYKEILSSFFPDMTMDQISVDLCTDKEYIN